MDPQEIMKKLQDPFPPEDIEWRVGSTNGDKTKGIALAYVTNRAIMSRLDSIFGPFGWRNEFREWKNNSQLCGISVFFNGEWITKWDGADDSQTEAVKGGLSDAMKRAGYQWGIGRYLYNLENVWVPIKPQGKSYVLVQEPQLPHWALPDGYEQKEAKRQAPLEGASHEPTGGADNDLNTIDRAREQKQQAAPPQKRQQSGDNKGINGKSRVIALMNELKWDWKTLGAFASDVLGRKIGMVLKDITIDDEWKKVEEQMLITKQAS